MKPHTKQPESRMNVMGMNTKKQKTKSVMKGNKMPKKTEKYHAHKNQTIYTITNTIPNTPEEANMTTCTISFALATTQS